MARTKDLQAFNEAKDLVEQIKSLGILNWTGSSNPLLQELEERLREARNKIQDGPLLDKLDLMIKKENLADFDIGYSIVNK